MGGLVSDLALSGPCQLWEGCGCAPSQMVFQYLTYLHVSIVLTLTETYSEYFPLFFPSFLFKILLHARIIHPQSGLRSAWYNVFPVFVEEEITNFCPEASSNHYLGIHHSSWHVSFHSESAVPTRASFLCISHFQSTAVLE